MTTTAATDGPPRCRVCDRKIVDPGSIALSVGPRCRRRLQPTDIRRLAKVAAQATVCLHIQLSLDTAA
ncbi:DUF6011 domain-containing protein [Frankia sp. Cas3]|uniref:DUF6011 domain-containing protein n=1 Tax=Frankia sp. Cas3 TaxID=3073926 RepID=UPI003A0FFA30